MPKIWKNLIILLEMRKIIPVSYQISSARFLSDLHLANLSEQELNELVEQALGDGPTKQQTGLYQPKAIEMPLARKT